jgi:hypothetical protein
MEEAPENGKESYSAHANGMNKYYRYNSDVCSKIR